MKKTLLVLAMMAAAAANAKTNIVLAYQPGWAYLPLHVMASQKLVEKHAKALGVDVVADYKALGTPAMINDAMNADKVQFGAVGIPSLITLNDKSKGDYKAVGMIVSLPMFLNTTKDYKSICDFKEGDKIALPSVKVSVQAVTLQMASKKLCGGAFKLDKYTVSSTHPDGVTGLISGSFQAHFTSPPFQYIELENKGVKKLLSSYDVLNGKSSFIGLVGKESFNKENPAVTKAVGLALEEAQKYIRENIADSAKLYFNKENPKNESLNGVLQQMSSKEVEFTPVPQGIEAYSNFMNEVGSIKSKPTWKDLTFSNLHNKKGS